ncbi:hypothetical protein Tsubulata_038935 [Turnera subulata]|uniref:Protein phosphatase n=1 Tax=Turnera subulata TaxID=218843 RepID=A0A9Q0GC86_9ROSI|nr:hypothetical protein Tsubulata_038935 [Turnera subulata]
MGLFHLLNGFGKFRIGNSLIKKGALALKKRKKKVSRRLKMIAGSSYLPKENKHKPMGEDAHFVCNERQAVGVADGVGGWAIHGIDAGIYARELMNNTVAALALQGPGAVDPKQALLDAHSKTTALGSSTACIVSLKGRRLRFANVGDSGFMVFRAKRLAFRSPVQQYRFNFPYQLQRGGEVEVVEGEVWVEPGDIVVVGTDGLLDNMFASEIEEILQTTEGRPWPEQIAWTVAAMALENAKDENYKSPFQCDAAVAGQDHIGGKYDDITVVVAEIEPLIRSSIKL